MQVLVKKYLIICNFISFFLALNQGFCSTYSELKAADSLFATAGYTEAYKLYKKNFKKVEKNNPELTLKLAFLSERSGNYSDCLFYLSTLSLIKPSRALFEKMADIAGEYNLKGYEFDDYSYFIIFYRRYGSYLPLLLLLFAGYIVYIMVIKTKNREPILMVHKLSILGYLIIVLGLINLPDLFQSAIITNPKTFLRNEPSSASKVISEVGNGHRIIILGSVDHWDRVIWENSIVYIRKSDVRNI